MNDVITSFENEVVVEAVVFVIVVVWVWVCVGVVIVSVLSRVVIFILINLDDFFFVTGPSDVETIIYQF